MNSGKERRERGRRRERWERRERAQAKICSRTHPKDLPSETPANSPEAGKLGIHQSLSFTAFCFWTVHTT